MSITKAGASAALRGMLRGRLYVTAHTGSPAGGTQDMHELDDSGYARVPIEGAWRFDEFEASNLAGVQIGPMMDDREVTITHVGIGTMPLDDGELLGWSKITPATLEAGNVLEIDPGAIVVRARRGGD